MASTTPVLPSDAGEDAPGPLVIYGDFNCPFSALASERAARAVVARLLSVEWRAVQHLPALPAVGEPVGGEVAAHLTEELELIQDLLVAGESFPAGVPGRRVNTALATGAFAVATGRRGPLRRRIFRAHWFEGLDIGDPEVLVRLGAQPPVEPPEAMRRWQRAWEALDEPITPMMVWPDGTVVRGLKVLNALLEVATHPNEST